MKKPILLVSILCCTYVTFAQLIGGQILDQDSKKPIDFASIYIDGTFLGTTPDQSGSFTLDVSGYTGRTLSVSAIGYQTTSIRISENRRTYDVFLTKAVYEILEVSVESESLIRERETCLKIFRKEFLGSSSNAKNSFIMNEEVISFNYHSNKDTLKAIARKPLVIVNHALGYQITYYLDKFEFIRRNKTTVFTGNISFNLDLSLQSHRKEEMEKKRRKTYLGSCKHFFSALWAENLRSEGFFVQRVGTTEPLKQQEFVLQDARGNKFFYYLEELEIAYNHHLSTVSFLKPKARFEKDGFFEPEAILWYDYMAMARIADWLPYEYAPVN